MSSEENQSLAFTHPTLANIAVLAHRPGYLRPWQRLRSYRGAPSRGWWRRGSDFRSFDSAQDRFWIL